MSHFFFFSGALPGRDAARLWTPAHAPTDAGVVSDVTAVLGPGVLTKSSSAADVQTYIRMFIYVCTYVYTYIGIYISALRVYIYTCVYAYVYKYI